MEHVKTKKLVDLSMTTQFGLRPDPNDMYSSRSVGPRWASEQKQSRALSTIDMDENIKASLVADIQNFLEPSRPQWYANRGIPYRRGFLFHGPPGTGKTSFAFALAGHLKRSLFSASMNEFQSEADMKRLFAFPGRGDILLLEDIDSAGIKREAMKQEKRQTPAHDGLEGQSQQTGISLSGLLNAVDQSIHEGVILIMTTNSPESLDKALIRPGRIDQQYLFGNVDQAVAKSVFTRMYQDDTAPEGQRISPAIEQLATKFAAQIPHGHVTPAEIQAFLTVCADADTAVRDVGQWVKDVVEAKRAGRNIVGAEGFHMGEGDSSTAVDDDDGEKYVECSEWSDESSKGSDV
ncbi:P-loop containing nucleoside triphosphate hydrolase protein [Massariosphaeria phaeospora]|uniref:P-loop containing nucleoside triphosphate hydrolase protein n=1 Tax=Massariosphaeria phaeospora TaxID=100035 RepID=A0A7C8MFV6_9PLEO|nr:P-loop containing nucleoside triphosphate hydrolase protein [Massariosphaeria phaeospora]